jgi:predicted HicB family RNase H-like nuclease
MDYREAFNVVHSGRITDVKDVEELRSGLASLHRYYGTCHDASAKAAIESFENEISRRTQQDKSKTLHDLAMAQGQSLHGETMVELEKLKQSVDQLAKPHWVLWATLVATAIAAIVGVILLFR